MTFGIAAMATLGVLGHATVVNADDRSALAVLPLKLLDTSAEPVDQRSEHGRRLVAMGEALARELRGPGGFADTRLVDPEAVAKACPTETPECLMVVARSEGARFAFVAVLHKSSTLIMQIFARIVAVDSGATVVSRELNFRGDNDESWKRAKDFLVREIQVDLRR